jgi:hypothetical protein
MFWILVKEEKILGILLSLNEEPQADSLWSYISLLSKAIVCSNSGLLFVFAVILYSCQIKTLGLPDSGFLTFVFCFPEQFTLETMHGYPFLIGHSDMLPCYAQADNTLVSVKSVVVKMRCSQHLVENTDLCHCAPETNVWPHMILSSMGGRLPKCVRLRLWVLIGLILLFFSLTFYLHSLPIVTPPSLLPSPVSLVVEMFRQKRILPLVLWRQAMGDSVRTGPCANPGGMGPSTASPTSTTSPSPC